MNQPYIPFYVGDWLKDPKLSLCSPATRGVWIDMICRLHEQNSSGKIVANLKQIAQLTRSNEDEAKAALAELITTDAAQIYESNGEYTIVCKRMERQANLSAKRKQNGSKGGVANTLAKVKQNTEYEDEYEGLRYVRSFAATEGISEKDADWFYWKCRGNGWTNAGKPIKDWKATLRSWFRAGYLPSQKQQQAGLQKKPAVYHHQPPAREPSPEEVQRSKEIANEETQKLREKFRLPRHEKAIS